jgi:hypothetical protein
MRRWRQACERCPVGRAKQSKGDVEMARALTCKQCGESITAADDDALFEAAKAHFGDRHKFLPVTDDKIREQVPASAVDA